MARKLAADTPRVVTANRLVDGVVVYRTAGGIWSPRLHRALVVREQAAVDRLLAVCRGDVTGCEVVDLQVIPVQPDPAAGPRAISQREAIRAAGPTIALPVDRPVPTAAPLF
ncbi:DUF2849 domain-containing protein [Roseospira visakhapatnamensis]|uniref:DUF2849 domain-containing protein n=1 Tax=Roseospira visakhapatnamensis TaxID=390880 RepID=A0A7W6RE79_9PROT|nr:DUF2849 domain-containing protein [Roseospira visakhapatnamensis]MBB4266414.1 hypothetical protein [Roseospira visakhapatnamensis]